LKHSFLEGHSQSQLEALMHQGGPALVISGAGSGKTRILALRHLMLVNSGDLSSDEVITLALTRRAASCMKALVDKVAGASVSEMLRMDTIQALCRWILRDECESIGFSRDFIIYDYDDRFCLIRSILKEFKIHEALFRGIAGRISSLKADMVTPERFLEGGGSFGFEEKLAKVYMRYQGELRKNNTMDYDDLVMNSVRLLEERPDVLDRYRRQSRHVMVDDFQAVTPAQYRLVKLLSGNNGNIMVAADTNQWLGGQSCSCADHVERFRKDYRSARVFRPDSNYRSTPCISNVVGAVIGNGTAKKGVKPLKAVRQSGARPVYFHAATENEEAAHVAHGIRELYLSGKYGYSDFCVLYRLGMQLRPIEEAFRREDIPYYAPSAFMFYQKPEVKDALAYARVVLNPNDSVSLRRIINSPPRGMGETAIGKTCESARRDGTSLFETLKRTSRARKSQVKVRNLIELVQSFGKSDAVAGEILKKLLDESGYMEWLSQDKSGAVKTANVNALIEAAGDRTLDEFLDHVSVVALSDGAKAAEAVTVMTFQEAGGLEFPVVYVTGLEEGLLPNSHACKDDPELIEREKRLLYTGMTRSCDMLFLSGAASRRFYARVQAQEPSRFLKEIPADLCLVIERAVRREVAEPPVLPRMHGTILPFPVGARVRHITWGTGVVRDFVGDGDAAKITVNFSSVGVKRLALKFANLEVI
jgi:DNA helicase-2/ATP-dependent DNA helicase PcrA